MADERTIRERFTEEVKDGFDKSSTVVANNTREIMGDALGSLVDDIKNLASGAFNIIKGTISTITGGLFGRNTDEKQLDETEEQTNILSQILNIFKRGEKKDARNIKDGGNPFIGVVITMLGAVTGLISGYLATALGPFKSLGIVIKPFIKGGAVFKFFSEVLPQRLTFLQRFGPVLNTLFGKVSGVFSTIVKSLTESKLFGIGAVIGKMLFWFRFLFDTIKTIFSDMSVRDKILGVSAKLLSLVGEIPEMIINGLLKLFGSEFRVDFGKDAIINAVNNFSDWLFPNVTVPVLDFITKDVPNFFSNLFSKLNPANLFEGITSEASINSIKNVLGSVTELPKKITEWLKGKVESIISKIPKFLLPKSLENFKFDTKGDVEGVSVNQQPNKFSTDFPLSEMPDRKEMAELKMETQRTNEKLDRLIRVTEQQNKSTQQVNNTLVTQQNNVGKSGNEIPTENENVGLNILNGAMY